MNKFLFLLLCWGCACNLVAQRPTAEWMFRQDTLALGLPLAATLVLKYPLAAKPLLPDSTVGYPPFEIARQLGLSHRQQEGQWVDSLHYLLRSFSLASLQHPPAQLAFLQDKDTLHAAVIASPLRLNARVPHPTTATAFQKDLTQLNIQLPPNYTLWLLLGLATAVLLTGTFMLGRKPALAWLRLRKLARHWQALQAALTANEAQLTTAPVAYINTLNRLWKNYLDEQLQVGLRSLTAKEARQLLSLQSTLNSAQVEALAELCQLEEAVNFARRALPTPAVQQAMPTLQQVLVQDYNRRREASR